MMIPVVLHSSFVGGFAFLIHHLKFKLNKKKEQFNDVLRSIATYSSIMSSVAMLNARSFELPQYVSELTYPAFIARIIC